MAWISVNEKFPEEGVYVVGAVFRDGKLMGWDKQRYSHNAHAWISGFCEYGYEATHWMPLPPVLVQPTTSEPNEQEGLGNQIMNEEQIRAEFERERRYIVFKISDVEQLDAHQHRVLNNLCEAVQDVRQLSGKPELECVVVEADWPEYETVWRMIQDRVEAEEQS